MVAYANKAVYQYAFLCLWSVGVRSPVCWILWSLVGHSWCTPFLMRDISFRLVYLHSYSEPLSVVTRMWRNDPLRRVRKTPPCLSHSSEIATIVVPARKMHYPVLLAMPFCNHACAVWIV